MAGEPTVLVVEDEPAQREVLVYNIAAEGYLVQTAASGDEALLLVQEVPPDLVHLHIEREDRQGLWRGRRR